MRIFLSWSGDRSRQVAQALKEWLPQCIQSLDPWLSLADIEKGANWFDEVKSALESSDGLGIFCLTPENLRAPWLNFEAGVLAVGGRSRVCALLLGLDPADVQPPLSLFQQTSATKEDIRRLLGTLNNLCERKLTDKVLERAFESNWQDLSATLDAALAAAAPQAPAHRSTQESLTELVSISRRIEAAGADQSAVLRQLDLRLSALEVSSQGLGLSQAAAAAVLSPKEWEEYRAERAAVARAQTVNKNVLMELAERTGMRSAVSMEIAMRRAKLREQQRHEHKQSPDDESS